MINNWYSAARSCRVIGAHAGNDVLRVALLGEIPCRDISRVIIEKLAGILNDDARFYVESIEKLLARLKKASGVSSAFGKRDLADAAGEMPRRRSSGRPQRPLSSLSAPARENAW